MTITLTGSDIRRIRQQAGVEVKDLAPRLEMTAEYLYRIEAGRKGKVPIEVPKRFAGPFRDALLAIQQERIAMIQEAFNG